MAVQTIKATIQMRKGNEKKFDPDKMTAGEWAVSLDSKKVWMCFRPGLVLRMATYEGFEQDMIEIQDILATCQDIQAAVERFMNLAQQHASHAESWSTSSKSWAVGGTGTREGENTNNSKYWSQQAEREADRAKMEADRAAAISGIDIDSELNESSANPVQNRVVTKELNKKLSKEGGDGSNIIVNFEQAMERLNVSNGDKFSVFAGKVKKWFFDLKQVAFSGNYNDLNNKLSIVNNLLATSSGYVLDATQGKILNDKITEKHNELVGEFDALGHERYIVKINPGGNAILTFKGASLLNNRNYIIQLSTIYTSTFQYRRYLLRGNVIRIIDNIAPANITANFNVPELVVIDGTVKVHFEGDKSTSVYSVAVIIDFLG